jgi:hypothetical protein
MIANNVPKYYCDKYQWHSCSGWFVSHFFIKKALNISEIKTAEQQKKQHSQGLAKTGNKYLFLIPATLLVSLYCWQFIVKVNIFNQVTHPPKCV